MKINSINVGSGAVAGYTPRCASDPGNPYDGFNICHYTNDTPVHISECRNLLVNRLGLPVNNLIVPRQTHSTNVEVIDSIPDAELTETDGLVTKRRDIVLCINTADCVPVLFHDPVAGVIGICHAGWRGMVNGVIQQTVNAMLSIGASPQNILSALGPCICTNCFEVGPEVAEKFSAWPQAVVRRPDWPKPHINLAAAAEEILRDEGIRNVTLPPDCTRCNWQQLFSARRLGINSGRMLTFIRRH